MKAAALLQKSREKLRYADYLISQALRLKDSTILHSGIKAITESAEATLTALLTNERELKRGPAFGESFEMKIELFKEWAARQNLSQKYSLFLAELKDSVKRASIGNEWAKKSLAMAKELLEKVESFISTSSGEQG
ncbi:MAG: hypothetical protein QXU88_00165 [Candidatus Woesearchaeota archaeon]